MTPLVSIRPCRVATGSGNSGNSGKVLEFSRFSNCSGKYCGFKCASQIVLQFYIFVFS